MTNRINSVSSHTQLYIVIKAFSARLPDELSINEGDLIDLISDDSEFDDGWYMGKNLTTNQVGLYPKVFTQIKRDSNDFTNPKPSLLRSRSRRTPQGSPITPTAPSKFFDDHQNSSFDKSTNSINSTPIGVNRYVNDIDKALKELNINEKNDLNNSNIRQLLNNDDNHNPEYANDNNDQIDSNSPLNPVDVENWTPEDVAEYFSKIIDLESANKFIIHKISGNILLELELAYLKELDINSFGTRFEIYKEIENLRNVSRNSNNSNNQLNNNNAFYLNSTTTNSTDSSVNRQNTYLNSNINRFTSKQTQRPQSTLIDQPIKFPRSTPSPLQFNNSTDSNIGELDNELSDSVKIDQLNNNNNNNNNNNVNHNDNAFKMNDTQFVSPRKAPKPPSYPSPVSNNPTKFGIRSPEKPSASIIPKLSHPLHSRNSSMGNASSIYIDTSPTSFSRRHSSIISQNSNSKGTTSNHRRYSSIINANDDQLPDLPSSQIQKLQESPERRSVSAKELSQIIKNKDFKRVQSDTANIPVINTSSSAAVATAAATAAASPKARNFDSVSSPTTGSNSISSFRNMVVGNRSKTQTSAFQEGIRTITPDEALQNADYSGWMFKRGNLSIGSWKHRFFTLHKTRLSYYITTKDTKERGLIDITSHRVLPATEAEDKLSAVYAASAGYGRYCFKLVPPAPGSRKGLTFTQQKVHYFAVETKEEMRNWMSALMKATIELDETIPAISSCVTPTIPLQKAQELMAVARENAKENFDNLQKLRENQNLSNPELENYEDSSLDDTNSNITPSSTDSIIKKPQRISGQNGINKSSSPLNAISTTSHLVTSKLGTPSTHQTSSLNVSNDTPARMASTKVQYPTITKLDGDDDTFDPPPQSLHSSNSFSRRLRSLRRVSKEKE
jgi:hypothetical protein